MAIAVPQLRAAQQLLPAIRSSVNPLVSPGICRHVSVQTIEGLYVDYPDLLKGF